MAAGRDVAGRNNGDRAGKKNGGGRGQATVPEPSAEPGHGAEHGEGSNPRESSGGTVGVTRPLTLEADGRATERGNQEADQPSLAGHGGLHDRTGQATGAHDGARR